MCFIVQLFSHNVFIGFEENLKRYQLKGVLSYGKIFILDLEVYQGKKPLLQELLCYLPSL